MLESAYIKKEAAAAGFDICGITRCRKLAEDETRFRNWLEAGYAAELEYLSRNLDKRFDPSRLVEGAKTVVVCGAGYKNRFSDGYPADCGVKVASYACTRDYHTTIKGMLRRLFEALRERYPEIGGRIFTDSAPLLEKRLAIDAGLGWRGRQSLLITPQFGSYVLLGELVLTDEADEYDTPLENVGCGECRRCADACPNKAILDDRCIDASRCISCATVEGRAADGTKLHGWIFGCDECQSCCPYNKRAPQHRSPLFDPVFDPLSISREEWLATDEETFRRKFGDTPLMRSGIERIKRNLPR